MIPPINCNPTVKIARVVNLEAYKSLRLYRAIVGASDAVLGVAWSCPSCKAKAGDLCKRGETHPKRAALAARARERNRYHERAINAYLDRFGLDLRTAGFVEASRFYERCARLPLADLLEAERRRREAN